MDVWKNFIMWFINNVLSQYFNQSPIGNKIYTQVMDLIYKEGIVLEPYTPVWPHTLGKPELLLDDNKNNDFKNHFVSALVVEFIIHSCLWTLNNSGVKVKTILSSKKISWMLTEMVINPKYFYVVLLSYWWPNGDVPIGQGTSFSPEEIERLLSPIFERGLRQLSIRQHIYRMKVQFYTLILLESGMDFDAIQQFLKQNKKDIPIDQIKQAYNKWSNIK